MLKLSGTLAIRSIKGSRGDFNVGRLLTEIGEFAVKDPLIEEYEEGRYEGEFGISGIFPSTYFTNGRTVVEIRARLGSIALKGIEQLTDEDALPTVEHDPIEDAVAPIIEKSPEVIAATPAPTTEDDAFPPTDAPIPVMSIEEEISFRNEQEYRKLFGTLWPLQSKVKLDPTVDRQAFRAQRDALKDLGFKFQPLGQLWVKE
ncbi:MAG: DUF3275 family protein [Panacagrimonas sp.]